MDLINLLQNYNSFLEEQITDRFFKHQDLLKLLEKVGSKEKFDLRQVGNSVNGLLLNLVIFGNGPCRVFLWSQMHGDEATATMALADLFNFLSLDDSSNELRNTISNNCTLYILPMVNPDGAEVFTRRNAMEIDINRDFHSQQSAEGKLLRSLRDEIQPHFGFNLHDQSTLWSAGNTGNPATISLLAPAYDEQLSINPCRQNAMQVIAAINSDLQKTIPGYVGRFDDEYEPRAFGDNFQSAGTSTILIEAGGYMDDPEKQHIRKLFFTAILSGLISISERSYLKEKLEDYFLIPENKKLHFHILLRNCKLEMNGVHYSADIGLIAEECINNDLRSVTYSYLVNDVGDLSAYFAYEVLNCETYKLILTKKLKCDDPADLILQDGLSTLLCIENGIITNKNL